jgi:hypothetical protein
VADTLDREFAEQPLGRRLQALRKVALREAHRSERLPSDIDFLLLGLGAPQRPRRSARPVAP